MAGEKSLRFLPEANKNSRTTVSLKNVVNLKPGKSLNALGIIN
jgi:hypothetical protein